MYRTWCVTDRNRCVKYARIQPSASELAKRLRDFAAATAYAPHQVYIGNIAPEKLSDLPKPWYERLIEGATPQGPLRRSGRARRSFMALLAGADQFDLVSFEESWFQEHAAQHSIGRAPRLRSLGEIQTLCEKGALRAVFRRPTDRRVRGGA